tara:strand:+ start:684 stop:1562 length:879 start_codon:yes stop_codon:yes gene_type:complete
MIKIFLIILFLFSCSKQENPITTYPFKGIVIDIFEDKQQMMIKHDEVPGFMMEMTMMFNIDSSINLYNYEIGDSLNFMFNIIERKNAPAKTWADKINIVGHRDLDENEIFDDFFEEDEVIQIGEKISNFSFLDMNGNNVGLSSFGEKIKFISFIFSRCPMPNFCPAVILKNQYLVNQFKNNPNIEFIIISFDYSYDTPKVLKKAYGDIFDGYENVHFLSSYENKTDILKLTMEAGLGFSGIDEGDPRDINHTLKSLLISPQNNLIESFGGDSWLPKEVELKIENILKVNGLD